MKHILRYFCCLLVVLLFANCTKDEVVTHESPVLVVEGWIEDGQHPHVLISSTIEPSFTPQDINSLEDNILHWAKVTISDGEQEVILTGKYDQNYLPPYVYSTSEIIGKTGGTYILNIDYGDYHASATTTIPEMVPISSLTQQKKEGSDSLYSVVLEFDEPQDTKNYYQIFTCKGANAKQPLPAYLGIMSDEVLDSHVKANVYPSQTVLEYSDYDLYFHKGDCVCIRLSSIDEKSYSFWRNHSDAKTFGNNFLMPYTQNLNSNIQGGYGFWCGYGSDIRWLIIGQDK